MHRLAVALLTLAALSVTACTDLLAGTPRPSPSATVEPSIDVAVLTSTAWRLVEIAGEAIPASPDRSIAFGVDGSVAGNGGCNRFGGAVTLGPGTLAVGELVVTEAGCANPAEQAIETRFLEALDGARTWRIGDDERLVIDGASGSLVFAEA